MTEPGATPARGHLDAEARAAIRERLALAIVVATGAAAALILLGMVLLLFGARPFLLFNAIENAAWFLVGPFHGLSTSTQFDEKVMVDFMAAAVAWFAAGRIVGRVVEP